MLQQELDAQKRASMVSTDLVDDLLDFSAGDGGLWFPVGAAFRWDGDAVVSSDEPAQVRVPDPSDAHLVLVGKHWVSDSAGTGARLIESANLRELMPKLAAAGITLAASTGPLPGVRLGVPNAAPPATTSRSRPVRSPAALTAPQAWCGITRRSQGPKAAIPSPRTPATF